MSTPSAALAPAARRRSGRRRQGHNLAPYFFCAPFLLLFAVFFVLPIIYALGQSLFLDRGTESLFVGLDNYGRVLHDSAFFASIGRVLLFGIVQAPLSLILAVVLALLLDSRVVVGKAFFRLAFFVPYAVPGVVAVLMWGYLYSPDLSVITQMARAIKLSTPDFLGPDTLLWSIANIVTWEYTGYNMIVLYSVLQSIPQDLYEAARIDGCGGLGVAWHIKIPLLRRGLVLTAVFSIIGTLQLFAEPQILATMTSVDDAYTPTLYAYNYAFSYSAFNYSAAISFVLALVSFVASYGFLRLMQRGQEM